jgi:hypothetical protein
MIRTRCADSSAASTLYFVQAFDDARFPLFLFLCLVSRLVSGLFSGVSGMLINWIRQINWKRSARLEVFTWELIGCRLEYVAGRISRFSKIEIGTGKVAWIRQCAISWRYFKALFQRTYKRCWWGLDFCSRMSAVLTPNRVQLPWRALCGSQHLSASVANPKFGPREQWDFNFTHATLK